MIRITNVFQRPNTDVPFHIINMTQELFEHVKTTYKDTGKIVSTGVTKSDDLLTMTAIWIWKTPEDHKEYQADPIIKEWIELNNNYNLANGIIRDPILRETI